MGNHASQYELEHEPAAGQLPAHLDPRSPVPAGAAYQRSPMRGSLGRTTIAAASHRARAVRTRHMLAEVAAAASTTSTTGTLLMLDPRSPREGRTPLRRQSTTDSGVVADCEEEAAAIEDIMPTTTTRTVGDRVAGLPDQPTRSRKRLRKRISDTFVMDRCMDDSALDTTGSSLSMGRLTATPSPDLGLDDDADAAMALEVAPLVSFPCDDDDAMDSGIEASRPASTAPSYALLLAAEQQLRPRPQPKHFGAARRTPKRTPVRQTASATKRRTAVEEGVLASLALLASPGSRDGSSRLTTPTKTAGGAAPSSRRALGRITNSPARSSPAKRKFRHVDGSAPSGIPHSPFSGHCFDGPSPGLSSGLASPVRLLRA